MSLFCVWLVRYRSVVLLGNSVARAFGLKGQLFEVQKRGLTRLSSRAKIHVDLDQRSQSFNLLPRVETNFCQVGVSTSLWGESLLVWTSRRLVAVMVSVSHVQFSSAEGMINRTPRKRRRWGWMLTSCILWLNISISVECYIQKVSCRGLKTGYNL